MIREARIAGVGFFDVYDMTTGELNEWIDAVSEKQRRDAQVQSIIAYRQAMLTADAVLTKMNGVSSSYDPIDWFPFWTAEERKQIKRAQLIQMIERQKQAIIANSDYADKQEGGAADGTDI